MSLAIYTFFFTRSEYYIDTAKGEVIKTIKWLFIATNRVESINQYRAVVICLGDNVPNSNWQAGQWRLSLPLYECLTALPVRRTRSWLSASTKKEIPN